ncbi:MAG: acylphosphatase [Bacteroidia bacterium]|nr:acylphosphatase [Sphingobacteriaceae bacterium]MBP9069798.1 acylphosphatase [Bacteroidia bacterium]
MELHYNIFIKGKVQGVRYRATAQAKAHELNLTGFIRNLIDGTVYVEAEGEQESLSKFIDWCYLGSPRAKVSEVNSEEGELKNFRTFEVRK